ncbi:dihydrolipoamide acetyltransferase family protein [Sphingobacterium sp. JB170]|uniref:dihydrolipoamide acetyltransferase family protein n=1 Tax=Sphingobacterium sp. JB170 TaxID=1434842 RepID=UPI000B355F06|nr:dihydrolipoamide acetyltransferase family protein [Sphingobacterium sp. JB170]
MGIYKLVLPKMGESVSEATITKWVKAIGERVEEDDTVAEVATDKVDSEVPAPVSGTLAKILFEPNQVVQVGEVIAWIEIEGAIEQGLASEQPTSREDLHGEDSVQNVENKDNVPEQDGESSQEFNIAQPGEKKDEQDVILDIPGTELLAEQEQGGNASSNGLRFYSPLVRNIAQQEGLTQKELDSIAGTGTEGRVTKQDIFDFLAARTPARMPGNPQVTAREAEEQHAAVNEPEQAHATDANSGGQDILRAATVRAPGDEIIEMDRMRKLIANHMVHSVKTSPHVASFVEADVTNIVNWRNKWKEGYKKREGENITFTPIFIEAICKALKDFPMINVSIDENYIIKKKDINIGMAAALPTGNLIVPVIRNADQLSLVGLSKSVNDLAGRSRENKLKPDDTQGGTFTFTNIGAFGNIMGVPIINQPQAAILAVGTIKKRPAVLETEHGDVIAIRHMMYLSMSYDHRIIDGALGGTFLKRVADYLENWDTNRII